MFIKFIKFLTSDGGAHGIIRIGDINDFGVIGDFVCHGFQVVTIVFHWNPMDAPSRSIGQYTKSDERIGGADEFIIAE